jgi:hypothetical protein
VLNSASVQSMNTEIPQEATEGTSQAEVIGIRL